MGERRDGDRSGAPAFPRPSRPPSRRRTGTSARCRTCSASCRTATRTRAGSSCTTTGRRASTRSARTSTRLFPCRAVTSIATASTTCTGDGIVEIPVGPIHAGVIEPGHFRFAAVGELVLHLETRLFYTHRGIEKLAEGKTPAQALPIAERICGACALSHAVAYCQAIETMAEAIDPAARRRPAHVLPRTRAALQPPRRPRQPVQRDGLRGRHEPGGVAEGRDAAAERAPRPATASCAASAGSAACGATSTQRPWRMRGQRCGGSFPPSSASATCCMGTDRSWSG